MLLRVKRKSQILLACKWDESKETLERLRTLGLKWVGNTGHRDRPDECKNLKIRVYGLPVYVEPGDWLVKLEDGAFMVLEEKEFRQQFDVMED